MVNFAARREDEPLLRELGLRLTRTRELAPIGTVRYPGGEARVEAGAVEQPLDGVYELPGGASRGAPDWLSLWCFTVDDGTAAHLTVIAGRTTFTRSRAFIELLTSGVPLDVVTRAAGRLPGEGDLEVVQAPAGNG